MILHNGNILIAPSTKHAFIWLRILLSKNCNLVGLQSKAKAVAIATEKRPQLLKLACIGTITADTSSPTLNRLHTTVYTTVLGELNAESYTLIMLVEEFSLKMVIQWLFGQCTIWMPLELVFFKALNCKSVDCRPEILGSCFFRRICARLLCLSLSGDPEVSKVMS